eukprot:6985385-Ditylum_brightwellii.AAC.1
MKCDVSLASFTTDSIERKKIWSAHTEQIKQIEKGKNGQTYGLQKNLTVDNIEDIVSSEIIETASF